MRRSRLRSLPPTHTIVCDAVMSGISSPTGVNSRKVAECFATGPGVQHFHLCDPSHALQRLQPPALVVWIDMARVSATNSGRGLLYSADQALDAAAGESAERHSAAHAPRKCWSGRLA